MTEQEDIANRKKQFIAYYKDLPQMNLAASKIGRSDDTIIRWRKDDEEFAYQMDQAKADWAMTKVKKIRDDKFLLERVLRDNFANRQEFTGKEGKDLPTPILATLQDVRTDDSSSEATKAQ